MSHMSNPCSHTKLYVAYNPTVRCAILSVVLVNDRLRDVCTACFDVAPTRDATELISIELAINSNLKLIKINNQLCSPRVTKFNVPNTQQSHPKWLDV